MMIGVAVLGAGRIGRIHGRNAASHPAARLVAVADPHAPSAQSLAQATGAEVASLEDVVERRDVGAILICTPTTTHADLIERGARAGKAVFCEKPVDLSSARIERCLSVVEGAGTPLMIGFNRRFDPNFASLRQRLAEGEVGEVEIVTILSRDPGPPPLSYIATSGGLFRDMMIHDLDMARFLLLGDEPVEVHALGSSLVDPEIGRAGDVDTAAVMLKTAAGRIVQISCSRRATYGYDQRVEVHGSKGMIRAGNIHRTTVEVATGNGFTADPVQDFFLERYAEAYRAELTAFLDAVSGGTAPEPTGRDGLMAQRLADAATESARTGKPIRV
jgi:myo-inositol 2-dehydrogenase / D-chiro-inositol 1-dehydrogenase